MLNQKPIFIVGFARGGSNILLNLLRSHPGVCSPRGETHQVFKGIRWHREPPWTILAKRWRYRAIRRLEGRDVFDVDDWTPRPPFSPETRRRVDRILYEDKLKARSTNQNRFKSQGVPYTRDELAASRLLCKNLNGLIFLSEELSRMYPDATFVALVRNGLAVCEGHIRRGWEAERIARRYRDGAQRILEDAERLPGYHIFRFEDLLADPLGSLRAIYRAADLDLTEVRQIRLEDKPVVTGSGERRLLHGGGPLALFTGRFRPKRLLWYDVDTFAEHFDPGVNRHQIRRLAERDRDVVMHHCGETLARLGYA